MAEVPAKRLPSPKPLGQLLPRVRPHRWRIAGALFCLIISVGIGLAFPQIVRHLNALADALSGAELPHLPGLETETGVPELNRAQISEVLRASRLGRRVTVRVAGARDLVAGSGSGVRPPRAKAAQRPRRAKS